MQGCRREHLHRDVLALPKRQVYFQGLGGAEDYRMEASSFVLVFREMYRARLFGVTAKAADVESGNVVLFPAPPTLAPLSPTLPHERRTVHTRQGTSRVLSKNQSSRDVQELHNFSHCCKYIRKLRERGRKQHSPFYGCRLINAHSGPTIRFSFSS